MKSVIKIHNLIGTVVIINSKDEDTSEQIEKIIGNAIKGLNKEELQKGINEALIEGMNKAELIIDP